MDERHRIPPGKLDGLHNVQCHSVRAGEPRWQELGALQSYSAPVYIRMHWCRTITRPELITRSNLQPRTATRYSAGERSARKYLSFDGQAFECGSHGWAAVLGIIKMASQREGSFFFPVWSLSVDRCQLSPLSYIYMAPPFIVPFVKCLWTCTAPPLWNGTTDGRLLHPIGSQ